MPKGMQSVNLDVICNARYSERQVLVSHFANDGRITPDEQAILDQFDAGTVQLEQAVQCLWIARAWMTAVVPTGTRRINDLERDYRETYGDFPVSDYAIAAD